MGKSVVWNEMKKTLLMIVMAAIIIGCSFSQGELEIADGVIWRLYGVQDLVVNALDYAFGAGFIKQSNSLANQAVYDWFDVHRDKWERIPDLGDFRRWRVKE